MDNLEHICISNDLLKFNTYLGRKKYEYQLMYYSLFVVFYFNISLVFSLINNIYLLAIAVFLMRFSGHLMSHTSTTAISRFYEKLEVSFLLFWFFLLQNLFINFNCTICNLFLENNRQGIAILTIIFLPIIYEMY